MRGKETKGHTAVAEVEDHAGVLGLEKALKNHSRQITGEGSNDTNASEEIP